MVVVWYHHHIMYNLGVVHECTMHIMYGMVYFLK